jgi:CheY-like chemotaxis protein
VDLVITDYAMPGMTGMVLAEHIRQIKPEIPIVLATGYAEPPATGQVPRTVRLAKPYRLEKLAALLNGLLSRGSAAQSDGSGAPSAAEPVKRLEIGGGAGG